MPARLKLTHAQSRCSKTVLASSSPSPRPFPRVRLSPTAPDAAYRPTAEVLSAILWIGVNLIENGTKLTQGTLDRIVLGLYTGSDTGAASMDDPRTRAGLASAELLGSLLRAGGSEVEAVSPEKLVAARWGKNLWNVRARAWRRTADRTAVALDVLRAHEDVGH